jgi:hypothetical protein
VKNGAEGRAKSWMKDLSKVVLDFKLKNCVAKSSKDFGKASFLGGTA